MCVCVCVCVCVLTERQRNSAVKMMHSNKLTD